MNITTSRTPLKMPTFLRFLLVSIGIIGMAGTASALTINVTFNNGISNNPIADGTGNRLRVIMEAAADYWEGIIKDPGNLEISFYYDNTTPGNAQFFNSSEAGGRIISGSIRFRPTPSYTNPVYVPSNGWYYDPSPLNNSEYDMQQILVKDLGPFNQTTMFNGDPPDLLESAFQGNVRPSAPLAAQDAADIWTYALHELGHALGMTTGLTATNNELLDNDYDFSSLFINGATCASRLNTNGGAHTNCTQCLMNTAVGWDTRKLPSASDVFSIATCPNPSWSSIDLPRKDFLPGGTTSWNTAGNWAGNRVPDSSDDAWIRLDSFNYTARLDGNGVAGNLYLGEKSNLNLNGHNLTLTDTLTGVGLADGLIYSGTVIVPTGSNLQAKDIRLEGGELTLENGTANITNNLVTTPSGEKPQGSIKGPGTININGKLINSGTIEGDFDLQGTLIFSSPQAAPWDLDGPDGNGRIDTDGSNITFSSGNMTDDFDGWMMIDYADTLTFNNPWTLGAGGLISFFGGLQSTAILEGGKLTALQGDIDSIGYGRANVPVELGGSLRVDLAQAGNLNFTNSAVISGGGYYPRSGTQIAFSGNTDISGGLFSLESDALLNLSGNHTITGGTYAGLGTVRLIGSTVINAPVTFGSLITDLDGNGGLNKLLTLNNDLTVNSAAIDENNSVFNSTLNINGSSSLLTINGPESWTMAGTMNTTTGTPFTFPSIDGTPFIMSGTSHIDGGTRWDALSTITGTVNVPTAGDRLALGNEGENRIEDGTIQGLGTLRAFNTDLFGHGEISCLIDFVSDSTLMADDGTLNLTGTFTNVPPLIGTASQSGILDIANDWTLPQTSILELNNGIVTGARITNEGLTRGFGDLRPDKFTNNGILEATGNDTLVIDSLFASDLDGVGTNAEVKSHQMNANEGNILLTSSPLDAFDATASISGGHRMTFLGGWQLGPGGELSMTGDGPLNPASVEGTTSYLNGTLLVDDHARLTTSNTFTASSVTTLADAGTVLHLEGDTSISAAATISGPGTIQLDSGTLTLEDGTSLAPALNHRGGTLEVGNPIGRVKLTSYTQSVSALLKIHIEEPPAGAKWDFIQVTGPAHMEGNLQVAFNYPGATAGDMWKVVSANSLTGTLGNLDVTGLPAHLKMKAFAASDGVYLKLAAVKSFAIWAAEMGLTEGDNDGPNDDPDGDTLGNSLEMFLGGDPLVANFNLVPELEVISVNGTDYPGMRIALPWHDVATGKTLSVARSGNLTDWSIPEIAPYTSEFDPFTCLETRTYRSIFPYTAERRQFLRIEIWGP